MHIQEFYIYAEFYNSVHSSHAVLLLLHYAFSHMSNIQFLARKEWMPVPSPSKGTVDNNKTDLK